MTTPWTPGPWRMMNGHAFPVIFTDHPDYAGQLVADTCESQSIYPTGKGHPSETEDHSEANARLIAAAPEMAELLEQF